MENFNEQHSDFLNSDHNLRNIVTINDHQEIETEEQDYDLDYDPNEMYYALNGKN
jgi:hypothetical protein